MIIGPTKLAKQVKAQSLFNANLYYNCNMGYIYISQFQYGLIQHQSKLNDENNMKVFKMHKFQLFALCKTYII
jgi:hypothetical protein